MKNNIITSLIIIAIASSAMGLLQGCSKDDKYVPTINNKEERQLIKDGNKLYDEGNYREAEIMYNKATQVNPNSPAATYNLALSLTKQLKSADNDSTKNNLTARALKLFETVPSLTKDSTLIAMAHHNRGNLYYENEAYSEAIEAYKQSLRHNPSDNDTRYNLRMAQLKLKEQQQQQDKDKNNQNQDQQNQDQQNQDQQNQDQQNQDQQNQDQQNQDQQNQDQQNQDNKDQEKQNQDKQNQEQQKGQKKPAEPKQQNGNQQDASIKMNERNMQQVLKAAQDKEDAVQRKIYNAGSGQERRERQSSRNKW